MDMSFREWSVWEGWSEFTVLRTGTNGGIRGNDNERSSSIK
jgi:hypothetical protein